MNVSFRLATEADLDVIDDILVTAYQFQGSRKEMLRIEYLPMQRDGWWLALADGLPVGFGGAVNYGTWSSIGMVCVYPEWQGSGIGGKLVNRILTWELERDCRSLVLEANPKAVSLYTRLSFKEEGITLRFRRDDLPESFEPSPRVTRLQAEDMPALAAFDARYFGGDRTKILVCHFQEYSEGVFVIHDLTGQITGYLVAQPNGFLGPWVASHVDDAEQLLVHAISFTPEQGAGLWIPATNEAGITLLKRYQFREQGYNSFMCYGAPSPGEREMIYALASPALG